VRLNLILTATDDAAEPIQALIADLDALKRLSETLGDPDPFAPLAEEASAAAAPIGDLLKLVRSLRQAAQTLSDGIRIPVEAVGAAGVEKLLDGLGEAAVQATAETKALADTSVQGVLFGSVRDVQAALTEGGTAALALEADLRQLADTSLQGALWTDADDLSRTFVAMPGGIVALEADLRRLAGTGLNGTLMAQSEDLQNTFVATSDGVVALMGRIRELGAENLGALPEDLQGVAGDLRSGAMDAENLGAQMRALADVNLGPTDETALALADDLRTAYTWATDLAAQLRDMPSKDITITVGGGAGGLNLGGLGGSLSRLGTTLGEAVSGITNGVMNAGMNAFMAMWGLQSMVGSGQDLAAIEAVMQQNNMSGTAGVNEAAQAVALLSAGGVSPQGAQQTLSGLSATLQQAFFTPGGILSRTGLQLESLGLSRSILTASPWMQFQAVAQQYQNLLGEGLGSKAQLLLTDTGLSQFAPLFANWSTMQQQARSQINLNMTPQQLTQAAQQGQSLAVSLEALTLAFAQFADAFAPEAKKVLQAMQGIVTALTNSKGKGPLQVIEDGFGAIGKSLGPVAEGLAALWAALKVFELGKLGVAVGAGVVDVIRAVVDVVKALGQSGGKALSALRDIGQFIDSLSSSLGRLGGGALKGLSVGSLGDVAESLGRILLDVGSFVDTMGLSLLPPVGKAPSPAQVLGGWEKAFEDIVRWMSDLKLPNLDLGKLGSELAGAIRDAIETVPGRVVGSITRAVEAIAGAFEREVVTLAGRVGPDIVREIDSLVADFKAQITGLPGRVMSDIVTAFETVAADLRAGISGLPTRVGDTITQAFLAIGSALTAALEGMLAQVESLLAQAASHVPVLGSPIETASGGGSIANQIQAQLTSTFGAAVANLIHGSIVGHNQNQTFTINVSVPAAYGQDRTQAANIARMVAEQLVAKLKLKTNIDVSF
jgi:hypothetical protein